MNRFGEQIYEDLLHFDVAMASIKTEEPREIAREVLTKAKMRAPKESLGDLEDALAVLDEVGASPIYDQTTACSSSAGRKAKEAKA